MSTYDKTLGGGAMSKNLGDAFVRVRPDVDTFAGEAESGISPGLRKVAGLVAGVFASGAALQGASALVGRASDLNETMSKSTIIFGAQAGMITKWSERSATSLGLPQTAALAAAASFGDMFSQIGFAEGASAKMSKSTIQMAADLGSFNNLETSDVLDRISASLRGEFDSLQAVIPNINAARVQSEALAMTGKSVASELTAQEKAAATLAIIHKDGARAAGDFARTSDGLANSQRVVSAQVENLKTKIGAGMLPVWQATSNVLRSEVLPPLIALADKWVPKVATGIGGWISNADPSSMLGRLGDSLSGIDWASVTTGAAGIGGSLKTVGKALADIDYGSLGAAFGSGVADTVSVFSVAIGFAAGHIDTFARALPLLVVAFAAYKTAQAASNVAALAAIPLQTVQIASYFALAGANRALATQMMLATGVENVGLATRIRTTIATAASTVAQLTAAAATKVWAAGQWLLNAALTANPIGLVVVAIGLLAGAVYLAWTRSETFRNVVTGAFNMVAAAGQAIAGFFVNWSLPGLIVKHWSTIRNVTMTVWNAVIGFVASIPGKIVSFFANWALVGIVVRHWNQLREGTINAATATVAWVRGLPGKITSALSQLGGMLRQAASQGFAKLEDGASDKVSSLLSFVRGIPGKAYLALAGIGTYLLGAGEALINGLIQGIKNKIDDAVNIVKAGLDKIKGMLPGSPIKWGPLKSWNGGGAGKRLMGLLAKGIEDGSGGLAKAGSKAAEKLVESIKKKLERKEGIFDDLKSQFSSISSSVASSFSGSIFNAETVGDKSDAEGNTTAGFLSGGQAANSTLQALIAARDKLSKMLGGKGAEFISQLFQQGKSGLILELANGPAENAAAAKSVFDTNSSLSTALGNAVAKSTPVDGKLLGDRMTDVRDQIKGLREDLKAAQAKPGNDGPANRVTVNVYDKSGNPKLTAKETARLLAFAGGG